MISPELLEALDRTALLVERDFYPSLTTEQIGEGFSGIHVRVVSDEQNLAAPAAQTFVTMAAIALTQTGAGVTLDMPDVPIAGFQPPLASAFRLRTALVKHLRRLPAFTSDTENAADIVVLVGDTAAPPTGRRVATVIRAAGDGWIARVSSDGRQDDRWTGDQPFGAALAAVAICADAFRLVIGRLGDTHGMRAPAMFSFKVASNAVVGVEPVRAPAHPPLTIDIVSAGAITNAALMTLARVPEIVVRARAFDDDIVGLSNLNRYPLFNADDLGATKQAALSKALPPMLEIAPVRARLTGESALTYGPLADFVLVGADDIPARWVAQQHSPRWLCVTGTTHFEVVISEHVSDGPCAGCIHSRDDPGDGEIPTVAFVSLLAGVLQAHRLLTYASTGKTRPPAVCWPLALAERNPIQSFQQVRNPECPLHCGRLGSDPAA